MTDTAPTASGAIAETITDLQCRVNDALVSADGATLERLVAPDCQIVGPKDYMITREQWIKVRAAATSID